MPGTVMQGGLSVLRPFLHLDQGQRDRIFNDAVDKAVAVLSKDFKGNAQFVVRGLRPYDLGETYDVWNETVAGSTTGAWAASIFSGQNIRDDTAIAIYGVYDASEYQAVTGVRLHTNGPKYEWDMFPLITDDPRPEARTGYGMAPFVVGPNISITVEYYTRPSTPSRTQSIEVVLLGVVAERTSRTINP